MPFTIFTTMRSDIAGLQRLDPRTYEALKMMIDELEDLFLQVNPIIDIVSQLPTYVKPIAPPQFTYIFNPLNIRFTWSHVENAYAYEIRRGTNWDTANFIVRNMSLSANIEPLPAGTYTFLIKAVSGAGEYSDNFTALTLAIGVPNAVSPSAEVVDNNVLLRWNTPPSTFIIDYYTIEREGVVIGNVYGTFATVFEGVSGTYLYTITPRDIVGNIGPGNTISVTVHQPSDYTLEAAYISDLSGTKYRTFKMGNGRLLACNDVETWQEHFTVNGWTNIQNQVDAGYPIYAQPLELDGWYEEVHDFGSVFNNIVVSLSWTEEQVVPTVSSNCQLATSTDNITYTPYVSANSVFADSMRYVKFKMNFATVDRRMVAHFFNITISLTVKTDLDSGKANVFAADVGGTIVYFNKAFKDVQSITLTSEGTTERTAIYDFQDIPNPTYFKILLFDIAGNRVDGIVSWKARGIT